MRRTALILIALLLWPAAPAEGIAPVEDNPSVAETGAGVSVRAASGSVQVSRGSHPGPDGGRRGAPDIRCWWMLKQGSGDGYGPDEWPVIDRPAEGWAWVRCRLFIGGVPQSPDVTPPTLVQLPGDPPGVGTVEGILQSAVDAIPLRPPNLETSPPGNTTFVNIPTYFAITADVGGGAATAQVDNNAIWVTARAELTSATFDFGDGTAPLACASKGSLWNAELGGTYEDQPAECGHTYADPGVHEVDVSLDWNIWWRSSDNAAESLWGRISRTATHLVTVDELEVVTR